LESVNFKQITNGFILHSTSLTPTEASASKTEEKQKFLELAPSELSRKLSGGGEKINMSGIQCTH